MCRNTCWRNSGKVLVGAACVEPSIGIYFYFSYLSPEVQAKITLMFTDVINQRVRALALLTLAVLRVSNRIRTLCQVWVNTRFQCTHDATSMHTLSLHSFAGAGIASIHAEVADSFLAVLARPRHQSPSQGRSAQWETGSWNQLEPDETRHQEDIPIYQQQFNNYQMKKGSWPKKCIHSSTLCQRNHQHWMWMWRSFRALPSSASWA